MMNRHHAPVSRAPNGCNAKPIQVTLRPEERARIEQVSARQGRSMASTCRVLILQSLQATEHPSENPLAT
jgi:hypothetical protein